MKNIGFVYQNYIIRISLTFLEAVVCDRFITKKTVSKLSDYRQAKTIKSTTTDQTKSPGKRPQESKIRYVHNDVDSSKNWMSNSNKGGNRRKIETTQNNKDGQ